MNYFYSRHLLLWLFGASDHEEKDNLQTLQQDLYTLFMVCIEECSILCRTSASWWRPDKLRLSYGRLSQEEVVVLVMVVWYHHAILWPTIHNLM